MRQQQWRELRGAAAEIGGCFHSCERRGFEGAGWRLALREHHEVQLALVCFHVQRRHVRPTKLGVLDKWMREGLPCGPSLKRVEPEQALQEVQKAVPPDGFYGLLLLGHAGFLRQWAPHDYLVEAVVP